jgi:predicted RNA-binding Zn-ribbon protein involved in translation (DUF1610 family)
LSKVMTEGADGPQLVIGRAQGMTRRTIKLHRIEHPGPHSVIHAHGPDLILDREGTIDYACPECGFVVIRGLDVPGKKIVMAAIECPQCKTVGVLPPPDLSSGA